METFVEWVLRRLEEMVRLAEAESSKQKGSFWLRAVPSGKHPWRDGVRVI